MNPREWNDAWRVVEVLMDRGNETAALIEAARLSHQKPPGCIIEKDTVGIVLRLKVEKLDDRRFYDFIQKEAARVE